MSRDRNIMKKFKDYSGVRSKKLLAVSFHSRIKNKTLWLCKCDCGNEIVIPIDAVNRGDRKSCGCLHVFPDNKNPTLAPSNLLLRNYKKSSKERGIIFKLSHKEFISITQENCHYCGIEPRQQISDRKRSRLNPNNKPYIYNGVDRKNNALGYILSNCVPCCKICNRAKREMSYNEYKEYIERIISFNARLNFP